MTRLLVAALLVLLLAPAAQARTCPPVKNPYAGSRYEGVDLSGIRAKGIGCDAARRVARGAHRKALGTTPTAAVTIFGWHGWSVRRDLRGDRDRYRARKGTRVVRWRF